MHVPAGHPHTRRKMLGLARATPDDDTQAWVVVDGNYVSARWPGDAHTFSRTFAGLFGARKIAWASP